MDTQLVRSAVAARRRAGVLPRSFEAPLFVLWEITYVCPLRCIHCYNHSGIDPGPQLGVDELVGVADQLGALQVHSVCLTGGEPAAHKGYLAAARRLRAHGISVGTPLSGWLLTPELAAEMAGLFDTIQVSLDGATAATHDRIRGVPGSHERALRACRILDEALESAGRRPPPTFAVAFVANRLNFDEIGAFIDLVAQGYRHVNEVRVQAIVPVGRAMELGMQLTREQTATMEAVCARKNLEYYPHVHVDPGDPTFHLKKPRVGHPWDLAVIDPRGRVRFSPWLSGEVGDLKERSLKEIWDAELRFLHEDPRWLSAIDQIDHVNDMQAVEVLLSAEYGRFGGGRRLPRS